MISDLNSVLLQTKKCGVQVSVTSRLRDAFKHLVKLNIQSLENKPFLKWKFLLKISIQKEMKEHWVLNSKQKTVSNKKTKSKKWKWPIEDIKTHALCLLLMS